MIRLGLLDFDTSHVVAFTQRFNHIEIGETEWVEGARVVAGCPGESLIMPERIPGYVEILKKYGIELVERPEELLGKVDAVLVESNQGSRHLAGARIYLEAGLPVFVDKPFAETVADVDTMIGLAEKHKVPLLSCSSLRYDPQMAAARARTETLGRVLSVDTWTPASLHPGNPGLLHYGIHGVEMLYTILGPGCKSVQYGGTDKSEVNLGLWENGHVSAVRGLREGKSDIGAFVHYEKGNEWFTIQGHAYYSELARVIVKMCETGQQPVPYHEMREIIAFCSAAVTSREAGGIPIAL